MIVDINKLMKHRFRKIDLVASNSLISKTVISALEPSLKLIMNNIYFEGYCNNRFYGGCKEISEIEEVYIANICEIFECQYANVQALSGSIANTAIYKSVLNKDDKVLCVTFNDGAHLTHSKISNALSDFRIVNYNLDESGNVDFNRLKELAEKEMPKMIISGFSCFTSKINHEEYKNICKSIGAYYFSDISHIGGLVAGKVLDNPLPHADIVMSTTHKTMRGFKGALIMTNCNKIAKKIDKQMFPKIQAGSSLFGLVVNTQNSIYMKSEEYRKEMRKVMANAKLINEELNRNIGTLSKETNTSMCVIDLSGKVESTIEIVKYLDRIGISTNFNSTYKDKLSKNPTGIRIGSNVITSRNISEGDIKKMCKIIADVCNDHVNGELKSEENYATQVESIIYNLLPAEESL